VGAEIPEGPLAFKSNQKPIPLTELEQMLVLTSMGGSTGWHFTISYNDDGISPSAIMMLTARSFHLIVRGPLEEPFHLLRVFIPPIFFLQMITGHTTSPRVTSTLLQRIT
jgi:hypothetical protein